MNASRLFVPVLALVLAVLGPGLAGPAEAAFSYVLTDDETGGDCSLVGQWDAGSRTCSLGDDISVPDDGFYISGDGITLNCGGHTITGNWEGTGIYAAGRSDVAVIDCTLQQFDYGIYLYASDASTVNGNTTYMNYWGIVLYGSSASTVNRNTNLDNTFGIGIVHHSSGNTINRNTAVASGYGIYVYDSSANTVNGNTVEENSYAGIIIYDADATTVHNNSASLNGYGIQLYRSDASTVVNNTADDNQYYGLVEQSGTDNKYRHNLCADNGLGGSYPAGLCNP